MSLILSRIHNSAPTDDEHLLLLQFTCSAWDSPVRLAVSSRDETVILPGEGAATFQWSGLQVDWPDKELSGSQDVAFSIGGVTVDVLEKIDLAQQADAPVSVTLFVYTQKYRDAPQKNPLTLEVVSIIADDNGVNCAARMGDVVNSQFPTLRYTASNSPGLKYFS